MATRYVSKFFPLGDGKKAGRLVDNHDPRSYRPPRGYSAVAELVEFHPVTQRYLGESQWWIFLLPDTINTVLSEVYLSQSAILIMAKAYTISGFGGRAIRFSG
jgi:hypothetical protein